MKSNKLVAAACAILLFGTLFAGTTLAVQSNPQDLPEESEVGSDVETTFEITELFDEFESWTLAAETELDNATWTIREYDQAGSEISREELDGQNVTQSINIDEGTATIEVRVTGTTPELGELSYDPPDRFVLAAFTQQREGGTDNSIATHETHHYTSESQQAREAIDQAQDAVGDSESGDARSSLDSAISAYESGNFGNAISLAERAEDEASQSQLVRTGLIAGGAVLVVLLLAVGGYRLYKSRQKDPSRLK